jgi:hypothetical protein
MPFSELNCVFLRESRQAESNAVIKKRRSVDTPAFLLKQLQ